MASQAMLFSSGVSTRPAVDLKRDSMLQFQQLHQSLVKPSSFASHLLYSPLPSSSSSRSLSTVALFKSKTKAVPKKAPPPKPKVEDGIFGTSGGIGFTKQNELFVGRVAMIGFAVSLISPFFCKFLLNSILWQTSFVVSQFPYVLLVTSTN
ncbi:unnamed protein product [Linum tenue]|uniref:Uncharacterized protein n=1 Tax=Linum tenue TaxID=586396 RepID=A0AAV0I662_9ROSI|nr:unnamed protein product [Linum tenue]